jgi:hypothetical protein
MAGDPNNAAVWANADVYVGALDAVNPTAGADFGGTWDLVGLLDGEAGFTENMSQESTDHFAWGGILVATTRKNFKLTRSFTALEDNETVMDLVYPGNTLVFDADGYAGDLLVPDMGTQFKIAFQTRTGDTIKRVISKNYAQIDERGESSEGEDNLASRPITVAIYPDENGVLFETFKGEAEFS